MTPGRLTVRVSEAFFSQLDEQLGATRGTEGQPSAVDFLVLELPSVVEVFATRFEELPEAVEGFPAARMLIATGSLVKALVVFGLLLADGSVEIVGVELDP